jgi:hypothetical protein
MNLLLSSLHGALTYGFIISGRGGGAYDWV